MQKKFVIIRNVTEGKLYLDKNPSRFAEVGIELAYFDDAAVAEERYPTAENVINVPVDPAPAATTETTENKEQ